MSIDKVWVLAESGDGGPTPVTLELLTEARVGRPRRSRPSPGAARRGVAGRPARRVRGDHRLRRR